MYETEYYYKRNRSQLGSQSRLRRWARRALAVNLVIKGDDGFNDVKGDEDV